MVEEDWKAIAARKQKSNLEKIPQEWRLPSNITNDLNAEYEDGVLTIPSSCKILSEREIELTEKYDASKLLQKIASKEAR